MNGARRVSNITSSLFRFTMDIVVAPIVQLALDFTTLEEAMAMAEIGIKAGVDGLEFGTPLIASQGTLPIGALVRAYPGRVVLADYKTMDSGGKNVYR